MRSPGPGPWVGLPGWLAAAGTISVSSPIGSRASDWADFLARDPATISPTSVCLSIADPWFAGLDSATQAKAAKALAGLLANEGAALDIGAYRDAPPGLRIWAGATIEKNDLAALMPWLDWAYARTRRDFGHA